MDNSPIPTFSSHAAWEPEFRLFTDFQKTSRPRVELRFISARNLSSDLWRINPNSKRSKAHGTCCHPKQRSGTRSSKPRASFATFHFGEIRPPIFESTELFARAVGGDTDIVGKEMYTFSDQPTAVAVATKSEEPGSTPSGQTSQATSISLRPEATASVCRTDIENSMQQLPQPVKLYYIGPMFRRERPQKGAIGSSIKSGRKSLAARTLPPSTLKSSRC